MSRELKIYNLLLFRLFIQTACTVIYSLLFCCALDHYRISSLFFSPFTAPQRIDVSILRAFIYDNFVLSQLVKFGMTLYSEFFGQGENAGFQHFLLFP